MSIYRAEVLLESRHPGSQEFRFYNGNGNITEWQGVEWCKDWYHDWQINSLCGPMARRFTEILDKAMYRYNMGNSFERGRF